MAPSDCFISVGATAILYNFKQFHGTAGEVIRNASTDRQHTGLVSILVPSLCGDCYDSMVRFEYSTIAN